MTKTTEDFLREIEEEDKALEDAAFEIYCKDQLRERKKFLDEAEERFNTNKAKMDELTIDKLKDMFNRYEGSQYGTPKERIIKELKSGSDSSSN